MTDVRYYGHDAMITVSVEASRPPSTSGSTATYTSAPATAPEST